jgi:hypothetical protein
MEGVVVALALLACPVGMGLMMWFMGKGMKKDGGQSRSAAASLDDLRDEQARLSAQIDQLEASERARDGEPLPRS